MLIPETILQDNFFLFQGVGKRCSSGIIICTPSIKVTIYLNFVYRKKQPTVSVAIRDLEIEFGISLFYRKGNRLILTEEGEELYNKATYILQYCNELQADYSSMARVKPPIRIGIPPMLSTVFFPELLTAFHRQYSEIAVVLKEYGSVRACNLVQDDTLDLALVNMEQYNIDKFNKALL